MKKIIFSTILFYCIPLSVLADQCAWIEKDTAMHAEAILKEQSSFLSYCELCGDKDPTEINIDSVSVRQPEGSNEYYEVLINDENHDLAYTYVKQGDEYHNLAMLVGCEVSGVSEILTY